MEAEDFTEAEVAPVVVVGPIMAGYVDGDADVEDLPIVWNKRQFWLPSWRPFRTV